MTKEKYDIFISYRRTAYDTANLIAVKLRHAGYKVFFDVDTLTAGKFNEQLLEVIKGCKDFIVVLPENALERCNDPEDWVRREVMCAMENRKNILPVMLDGFSWPKEMPEEMDELSNYQSITAVGHEYFDMAVERMKGYLKSKATKPIHQWLGRATIALGVILSMMGVGYGFLYHIASVTCKDIATKLTCSMDILNNLGRDCKGLDEGLSTLYNIGAADTLKRAWAEQELLKTVAENEKNLAMYRKNSPPPVYEFNRVENYVLAYYNTEKVELDAHSALYETMLNDMQGVNEAVKKMIIKRSYSQVERDGLATLISGYKHYLNAFYYGYLGSLSLLPNASRKMHFDMAQKWTSFPNGTPLDLSQEEYVQFQTKEVEMYEEEMNIQKEKELKASN